MSVQQECVDLFIPIATIEAKFRGGWQGFIVRHPEVYACGWHDDHLFRLGAMSVMEIKCLLDWWQERGLEPSRYHQGEPMCWLDLCVSSWGKPTLPCSWIAYDPVTGGAYLKGTESGALVGPEQMPRTQVDHRFLLVDLDV